MAMECGGPPHSLHLALGPLQREADDLLAVGLLDLVVVAVLAREPAPRSEGVHLAPSRTEHEDQVLSFLGHVAPVHGSGVMAVEVVDRPGEGVDAKGIADVNGMSRAFANDPRTDDPFFVGVPLV